MRNKFKILAKNTNNNWSKLHIIEKNYKEWKKVDLNRENKNKNSPETLESKKLLSNNVKKHKKHYLKIMKVLAVKHWSI